MGGVGSSERCEVGDRKKEIRDYMTQIRMKNVSMNYKSNRNYV